jgi:predicted metal-binding membrane protein
MRVWVPLLAIGAAAWLALILGPAGSGHGGGHGARWTLVPQAALMFAAMMVPMAGPPIRHVRDRSLARRRLRAVALFAASYALPWMAATLALLVVARWIAAGSAVVLTLAVAAVAVFQCSPWKQRSLNRCHAHPPLAAFGGRADLDVLRFGFSHAGWCIGSCSALMLLPMLVTHGHLPAMAAATLWIAGERVEKPVPPGWRWRGPGRMVRIALAQAQGWQARFGGGAATPRAPAVEAWSRHAAG